MSPPSLPRPETLAAAPLRVRTLLADGALRLEWSPTVDAAVERWLPLVPVAAGDEDGGRADAATLRVQRAPLPPFDPGGAAPTLRLGGVEAWVHGGAVHLRGRAGETGGRIDLAAGRAEIRVPAPAALPAVPGDEVYSALTLASALLLGRLGRALVHAAAVVAPDGGAWLLVGDSHAGKTTTTVNLIDAGWGWVSDDTVVLCRHRDGRVAVEGWPRRFHLDAGWEEGRPGRPRGAVDPRGRWGAAWRRRAPLAGLLFPRVRAGEPTRLAPSAAGETLAALIRQSPWLLADRGVAGEGLALLQAAAAAPAFALSLGLDTFRGGPPLLGALAPLGAP